jgi:hypothetical protein
MFFTSRLQIGHVCVPKRHFGVQAWANPAEGGTSEGGRFDIFYVIAEFDLW